MGTARWTVAPEMAWGLAKPQQPLREGREAWLELGEVPNPSPAETRRPPQGDGPEGGQPAGGGEGRWALGDRQSQQLAGMLSHG